MPATVWVFDIDGTLLDSAATHQRAFTEALWAQGFSDVDTRWDGYRHHTDSWIFAEVYAAHRGRRPAAAERAAFGTVLRRRYAALAGAAGAPETAGARAAVEAVAAGGDAVCFATGGMREVSADKLAALFPARGGCGAAPLATATEHAYREHIVLDAVARAAAAHGVAGFARVVCVGDGPWDALAARRLGFEFAGVAGDPGRFRGLCPAANVVPAPGALDPARRYPLDGPAEPAAWADWAPAGCACLG